MIVVPFEIKDISVELIFCFFLFLKGFCHGSLFLIKFVTLIVSTSGIVMFTPLSKTDPAEFISTHFTVDVIATLIFLDRSSTLRIWTHFGIRNYPVHIFAFTWIFNGPLLEHITVCWSMLLLSTSKAKWISAQAVYSIWVSSIRYPLCCIIAIFGIRTPLHIFVVVSPWLTVPSHIFF